jgi:hypothetical protein
VYRGERSTVSSKRQGAAHHTGQDLRALQELRDFIPTAEKHKRIGRKQKATSISQGQ